MHRLVTEAKVLDSEGKEVVKPPFLYGDDIADDDFMVVAEERRWLREVEGRRMFFPSMVRQYSIPDFQYESIMHFISEQIYTH